MKKAILLIAFCLSLSVIYAQQYVTCRSCDGEGKVRYIEISPCRFCNGNGYDLKECPQCYGKGEIRVQNGNGGYNTVPCNYYSCDNGYIKKRCGACEGTGEERKEVTRICSSCKGKGEVKRE